ncbi:MAG: hypothetical protein AAGF59_11265 [Pseudomonadota bacterium]
MPLLGKQQFEQQMWNLRNVYRRDNEWVGRFITPNWEEDPHMRMYIDAAFRLYEATTRNELKLTLLGGTEIRKAKSLVSNFGVTAVNGIQDPETSRIVLNEQIARSNGKGMTPPNATQENGHRVVPVHAVPVRGVGSILSETHWTPLLNDSLIVGAATAERNFQIALEPEEVVKFQQSVMKFTIPLPQLGPNPTERKVKLKTEWAVMENLNGAVTKEIWKDFVARNMSMLWNSKDNCPRVLARELLGLSFLGYKPVFFAHQLAFQRRPDAPDADFPTYVEGLGNVDFQNSEKRIDIIKHISEFLFGEDTAVCMPCDRPVIQPNDPRWMPTARELRRRQKIEF